MTCDKLKHKTKRCVNVVTYTPNTDDLTRNHWVKVVRWVVSHLFRHSAYPCPFRKSRANIYIPTSKSNANKWIMCRMRGGKRRRLLAEVRDALVCSTMCKICSREQSDSGETNLLITQTNCRVGSLSNGLLLMPAQWKIAC